MNVAWDRCIGCEACREICPFLTEYGTPARILRESPEVSFYCTSCRRCDGVCPQGLSPSAAFFEEKQRLVRQDRIPPAVRKALEGARRFAATGHGFPFSFYPKADTVFWPGCGLAAARPEAVRRVRGLLGRRLRKPVGVVLDCCFDPVYGLGDTDAAFSALREIGIRLRGHGVRQVVTGCLNCHKLLSEHLAEIEVVFVLELLPPESFGKQPAAAVYLHHPCPSSRWETIRNRADELAARIYPLPAVMPTAMETDLKSVPMTAKPVPVSGASSPHCCGSGGGLGTLHPGLADRFLDRIAEAAENRTIVTYCTGCQSRFIKGGGNAIHLLECLPGMKPHPKNPSQPAQWVNRLSLALTARVPAVKLLAGIVIALLIAGGIYLTRQQLFSGGSPVEGAAGSPGAASFSLPWVLRRFFCKIGDDKPGEMNKDMKKKDRT